MAVPLIQRQVKEASMNIIRRLPTDISCLSGVHQVTHMLIGTGLRVAATALSSVVSPAAAAPTTPAPASLVPSDDGDRTQNATRVLRLEDEPTESQFLLSLN